MGALGTIVTAAVTATVVIGGVIYVLRRKTPFVNDPNIITKEKFSSSDVLSWIDQIMPSIQTKAECTYSVNILPNSSSLVYPKVFIVSYKPNTPIVEYKYFISISL